MRIVVDCILYTTSVDRVVFGIRETGIGTFAFHSFNTTNNARTDYASGTQNISRINAPFDTRMIVDKDKQFTRIDGNLVSTLSTNNTPFVNTQSLFLGAWRDGGGIGRYLMGIIYSCQIYNNDVLVRDFITVPQNSTAYNMIPAPSHCMWDKVSGQYFLNLGTEMLGITEE